MKNGVASSKKIPLKMAERLKICCPLGYWPIRLAAIIAVHMSNWPGRQKKAKNVSASLRQGLSHLTAISAHFLSRSPTTSNMRHLFVVGEFVVVSHLKIFPLQLLGPADKPMAGPNSSKGKILR